MIKINKRDYINFYDIFSELGSYTFMLSALDGIVNSELYADNSQNPTYSILLTKDLNYIVGDLSSTDLKQELFDLSQSDNFLDYTGFIFLKKNVERMKEIFGKHTHGYKDRKNLKLMASDFNYVKTNTDAKIVIITPENIKYFKDFANYSSVYDGCIFYWEEFPKDSRIIFATALVKDNAFMSCCYLCGESSSENSCEIGVDTFEPFRRNGYAAVVCRETLKELIELGYNSINWHCFVDNIPSYKIASKLGYKHVGKSYLAWFRKNIYEE